MTKSKNKPMTMEEEYRNADVPMPNDMLNASNTEHFTKKRLKEMEQVWKDEIAMRGNK